MKTRQTSASRTMATALASLYKVNPGTIFRVVGTFLISGCTLYAILLPWVSSWIDKVLAIYCNLSEIYPGKSEGYRTLRV
jgi:hypothetical protein